MEPMDKTDKASRTRVHLFETAIELFAKKGFDATTMRDIAKQAKVSLGSIYYYYPSKENVVMAYYELSQVQHVQAMGDYFETEKSFEKRLHRLLTSKIDVAEPYKDMARGLFRTAADPTHHLSPFSEESKALRTQALQMFVQLLEGSDKRFHPRLQKLLPKYLWLLLMGLILFWIHDPSEGSKNTYHLIDRLVPMVVGAHDFLNSPVGQLFRHRAYSTLEEFDSMFDFSTPQNKGVPS